MSETNDRSRADEPTAAFAADAGRRDVPASVRTDPAAERQRVVQREKEAYGGMHFGVGFFGWLTATGMTVLLVAVITGIGALAGAQNLVATPNAQAAGIGGAVVLLVVLLIAYFLGGYVAGRMARFSGLKQGLAVWLWALLIAIVLGVVGAVAGSQAGIAGQLSSVAPLPFTSAQLTVGGIVTAVVVLIVTLVGALLGGVAGMRYHRRVDRAGLADTPVR